MHRQFQHSILVCQALASIELATRQTAALRLVPWVEVLAKAPPGTQARGGFAIPAGNGFLIPDAFFGIEYVTDHGNKYRFFCLEADRGTMPVCRRDESQSSYAGKIALYQEILSQATYRSHFGLPNLFVLTLTLNPQRLKAMARQCASSPAFLYKAIGEDDLVVPIPGLLWEPWDRADQPPFNISEAS
jgi:hypothetical protein